MSYIEKFNRYRDINLHIINSIKENRENLNLFKEREEAINEILSLDLDKVKIKRIYLDEGLDMLDRELEYILKEKMVSIKAEIRQVKDRKQANLRYATANRSSSFFSKRV